MEGYLDKRGRGKKISVIRPWSRRYFFLDPVEQTLSYYTSGDPAKRHQELRGTFDVRGGSIVESESKKEFVFDIRCEHNSEVLTLAASSAAERRKWILSLIAAATAPASSGVGGEGGSGSREARGEANASGEAKVTVIPPNEMAHYPVRRQSATALSSSSSNSINNNLTPTHTRQHSKTLEFNDSTPSPLSSLTHRKTGQTLRVELDIQSDKNLALPSKLKTFDYSRIVDLLKVNLSSRDQLGNVNDSNVYSSAAFLVSLNLLLREDLLRQLNLQNVGPDEVSSLLVNCFILSMVGLGRVSLEVFSLVHKYVSDLSDVDAAVVDNHRALAEQAFEWCLARKYVDKLLTCDDHDDVPTVKVKIALYGFVATGKTSVLFRYIDGAFAKNTTSTIGVDFRQRRVVVEAGGQRVSCLVDVWDTAGQEKYRSMTSNFIKGADGVFIVYDASALGDEYTDPEDQRAGLHYLVPPTFPSVLFGNKIDLIYLRGEHAKRELQARQNDKKETHFFGSALSGENVEEAFECLVRQVVSRKVRDEGMGLPHRKTIKLSRKSLRAVSSSASRGECC